MRLVGVQVMVGLALLLAAALWPKPDRPVLVVARDDQAAAHVISLSEWRVLDIQAILGLRILHLTPAGPSQPEITIPSGPGILLVASMAAGVLCR